MKADKVDIEKLFQIKSDKDETDNMMRVQKDLSNQFRNILVLFVELIHL